MDIRDPIFCTVGRRDLTDQFSTEPKAPADTHFNPLIHVPHHAFPFEISQEQREALEKLRKERENKNNRASTRSFEDAENPDNTASTHPTKDGGTPNNKASTLPTVGGKPRQKEKTTRHSEGGNSAKFPNPESTRSVDDA